MAKENRKSADEISVENMLEHYEEYRKSEKKSIFKMYLKNPVHAPMNWVTKICYRGSNKFWLTLLGVKSTITENQLTALKDHKVGFNPKAEEFSDEHFIIKKGKDKDKVDKKAQYKAIQIARRKAYKEYETKTGTILPKPRLFPVMKDGEQVIENGEPKMHYKRYVVTYSGMTQSKDRNTLEPLFDEDGNPVMHWFSTWYQVFDIKDIENFNETEEVPEDVKFVDNVDAETAVSAYIQKNGVKLCHFNDDIISCYVPSLDEIRMSNKGRFTDEIAYYSTLLHEVGHSTGTKERRNRVGVASCKGSTRSLDVYAEEELRAQFFSMFAQEFFGIDGDFVNDAAYIDSWWITKDPKKLARACDCAYSDCEWFFTFSKTYENKEVA